MSIKGGDVTPVSGALKISVSGSPPKLCELKVVIKDGADVKPPVDPLAGLSFADLDVLVRLWHHELEEVEQLFSNQAAAVNARDRMVLKCSEKLLKLKNILNWAKGVAEAIDHDYEYINYQQVALSSTLDFFDNRYNDIDNLPSHGSCRPALYRGIYETYHAKMRAMDDFEQVVGLANEMAKSAKAEVQDKDDQVYHIVSILGAHMTTLQRVEAKLRTVVANVEQVKIYLEQFQSTMRERLDSVRRI